MSEYNSFNHIATATTTVVKDKGGLLKYIVLNEPTAGIVTIYNNTAASGAVVGIIAAATAAQTLRYDATLGIGITIVTAGADDITVVFK